MATSSANWQSSEPTLSALREPPAHSTQGNEGAGGSSSVLVGAPILLVEDDEDTRSVLRDLLVDEGYSVMEAENGRAALDLLVAIELPEPFLVILDLGLPVMAGSELLVIMRSYRRLSKIPVLVISGSRRPSDVGDAEGILAYLPKPVDAAAILTIVGEFAATAAGAPRPSGPPPSGVVALKPRMADPPAATDPPQDVSQDEEPAD